MHMKEKGQKRDFLFKKSAVFKDSKVQYPTTNGGMQKWKLSWNTHIVHIAYTFTLHIAY